MSNAEDAEKPVEPEVPTSGSNPDAPIQRKGASVIKRLKRWKILVVIAVILGALAWFQRDMTPPFAEDAGGSPQPAATPSPAPARPGEAARVPSIFLNPDQPRVAPLTDLRIPPADPADRTRERLDETLIRPADNRPFRFESPPSIDNRRVSQPAAPSTGGSIARPTEQPAARFPRQISFRSSPVPADLTGQGVVGPDGRSREVRLGRTVFDDEFIETGDTAARSVEVRTAPFGRMLRAQLAFTIDSSSRTSPLIAIVTEPLVWAGQIVVPVGTELHGVIGFDTVRDRVISENSRNFRLVFPRGFLGEDGLEMPVTGTLLDREAFQNEEFQDVAWAMSDGSLGIRGQLVRESDLADIQIALGTFLAGLATGLQRTNQNAITGESVPQATLRNASMSGIASVIERRIEEIAEQIRRDGVYIRVPAGKEFYLYVTEPITTANAQRRGSVTRTDIDQARFSASSVDTARQLEQEALNELFRPLLQPSLP